MQPWHTQHLYPFFFPPGAVLVALAGPSMQARPIQHLYVHVPFCAHKCDYCAFYSHGADGVLIQRYVDAMVKELEYVAGSLRPRTVFFGGGTPSILSLRQWERIFEAFNRFDLGGAKEWTVECNPATVSMDKAKLWLERGVTRVSMGVQSLDEALLDRLGRVHSREMVFRSYDLLRRAGFKRVNVDLMFAIPGQSLEMWVATLREAIGLGSDHLSTYEVIYEEDTPLYAQLQAGEVVEDEDLACAMYEALTERAASSGLIQYEVSNFARGRWGDAGGLPSEACAHNVNTWRGGEYVGLGPSACGFEAGVRTRNWANTTMYCELLEQGRRAIEMRDVLSGRARAGEIAAFGLRMNRGWGFEEFRAATGFDLREHWGAEMEDLLARGWGSRDEAGFRLTETGLRFADAAGELFLMTESAALAQG